MMAKIPRYAQKYRFRPAPPSAIYRTRTAATAAMARPVKPPMADCTSEPGAAPVAWSGNSSVALPFDDPVGREREAVERVASPVANGIQVLE